MIKLEKISNSKYKATIRFIAGKMPGDQEEDIVDKDFIIQELRIMGTYDKAAIELDGTEFSQAGWA